VEDGVDNAVNAFYVHKTHHGSGAAAHLDKTALDHVRGAQFAPQVPGETQRTTAVPVSPVATARPSRDKLGPSGHERREKLLRLASALRLNRWPELQLSLRRNRACAGIIVVWGLRAS